MAVTRKVTKRQTITIIAVFAMSLVAVIVGCIFTTETPTINPFVLTLIAFGFGFYAGITADNRIKRMKRRK